MSLKSLSIIVVSWNAKRYLAECLDSIIRETGDLDAEIIIVDNASTDGSPEFVEEKFPMVRLMRNRENLGFAKANNIGLKICNGEYICLINSDVMIMEGCIDRMLAFMERHSDIGMLGPKIVGPDGTVQRSCMEFPTIWNKFCRAFALDSLFPKSKTFSGLLMKYWPHDSLRTVDVINGCFWMVRREALREVGLLDEVFFIYSEDIDWCMRFHEKKWKVVFYPDAQSIHYGGASSANAPIRFYIERQRANANLFKKHFSRAKCISFGLIGLSHHTIRLFGYILLYLLFPSGKKDSKYKIKRHYESVKFLMMSACYFKGAQKYLQGY